MSDKKKSAWNGPLISRRRMLHYGLAGMAGLTGGFWPLSALGETHLMSSTKTGGRSDKMFDTLEYRTLNGSFQYSSIIIQKDYIGEYICLDNLYDKEKFPGHSRAKLPDMMVKNIESNIHALTIVSDQQIDKNIRQYNSIFIVTVGDKKYIQPEPDQQHEYMFPQYIKIAEAFMTCMEYLKNNGDRFFIDVQCALDIDYKNHAVFTFQVQNKGTVHGKIKNFLKQSEYASTYHTNKGPGPIFTRSDCVIANANFDVEQPALDLLPNAPLVLKVRAKSAMPIGDWAFTFGLAAIQEILVDDGEARTYHFKDSFVTVTLD